MRKQYWTIKVVVQGVIGANSPMTIMALNEDPVKTEDLVSIDVVSKDNN